MLGESHLLPIMKKLILSFGLACICSPVLALTTQDGGAAWRNASISERRTLSENMAKVLINDGYFQGWSYPSAWGYLHKCVREAYENPNNRQFKIALVAANCAQKYKP